MFPAVVAMDTSSGALFESLRWPSVRQGSKRIASSAPAAGAGHAVLRRVSSLAATACLFLGVRAPIASAEIFPYEDMELQVTVKKPR